jgi:polysaccharide chain length determinant protein (PEP-CTERM system associated)
MNDIYVQFLLLLRSIWMRRWFALAVSWVVAIGGWAYLSTIPDRFESTAQIFVDTDTVLPRILKGVTVDVNLQRQIQMLQQTLLSRPNVEKAARMSDIDLTADSEEQLERMISRLQREISLEPIAHNLFKLTYQSGKPETAQRVVQSMLNIFVESSLGMTQVDIDRTLRFLDDQIKDYDKQLADAEARLSIFRQENFGLLGEENYYSRVEAEKERLVTMERDLENAIIESRELSKQALNVPKYIAIRTAGTADPQSGAEESISRLRQKLTDYDAEGLTEQHPDVQETKSALARVEQQYAADREAMLENNMNGDTGPLNPNATMLNPVWEQVQYKLVDVDTDVARLGAQMKDQQRRIDGLVGLGQKVPEVERGLARLDRDYGVIKSKHGELLSRREGVRIARDLEIKTDKVQFRTIEPPSFPHQPSSPNRPALVSLVLLAGIGAGLGIAFILGQLHTTYASASELRSAFDLPVLGTISAVGFETATHRVEMSAFSIILGGLGLAYVFVLNGGGSSFPMLGI